MRNRCPLYVVDLVGYFLPLPRLLTSLLTCWRVLRVSTGAKISLLAPEGISIVSAHNPLQHLQRPAPPDLSQDAPGVPSLRHADVA
jgi:hypothetical protein